MPVSRPAALAAALGALLVVCLPTTVGAAPPAKSRRSTPPSRFSRAAKLPSRGGVSRRAAHPTPPLHLTRPDVEKAAQAAAKAAALPGEIRAMWVVRDSMVSPAKIKNAVALAKKHHFNTLFVQVRGRGDAFYDSQFEPRSEELADQPLDFDPLAVAIEEGHKAGLEVHAWMNTFLVWHKVRRPYSGQHVVNQHPNWLVQNRWGKRTLTPVTDCEGAFLDPGLPEVRDYTRKVFLDVATRYDVDGIHFDYVRFPNEDWSFSPADLREFRAWLLPQLTPEQADYADSRVGKNRLAWHDCFKAEWTRWRQSVVMETVKSVSDEAHRLKPEIIVSAAVFPNYRVASQDKGQGWHDWLQAGILDAACPMTYNTRTSLVGAQVQDALANAHGRPIVAGIGAWQMPADSAIAKGKLYRSLGTPGINFFSYDGMTREGRTEAYLGKVSGVLFSTPADRPDWHRIARPALEPLPVIPAVAPPNATVPATLEETP